MKDPRKYYDEFSEWYERERHVGYHALIDDLEVEAVATYCREQRVLEIGCGTGLILEKVARLASRALGLDLSLGMLGRARQKGLEVVQADLRALPFKDDSFDTVYSFKVLAHIDTIGAALEELARVTRPGGTLVLEFYNRYSLRYVVRRLKRPGRISGSTTEAEIFTRFDTLGEILGFMPSSLKLLGLRGVRVVSPLPQFLKIPVLGQFFTWAEWKSFDSPLARFGGFLVLILKKN